MSSSTNLARNFLRSLIEQGVSDFVLSPGSRNAPLSIALNEAAEKGLINLHIKIDERGAAFFALGISKATDNYVALICTSGTAVANYAPAALEALHNINKLIFLTADRPARLRNTGANQTTDQVNIFQGIKTHDLNTFEEIDLVNGPIHINLQFDEPLLPVDDTNWLSGIKRITKRPLNPAVEKLNLTGNGLVIVGHDKGGFKASDIENFAKGLILISEDPLSFKSAIAHSSIFLADEKVREFLKPDYVVVIGRTTLSRSINTFIGMAKEQYVVDVRINGTDTKRTATRRFETLPQLDIKNISESYKQNFEAASKNSRIELSWSEQKFAELFATEIPEGSALFIGSSRPIRDIEAFAKSRDGISVFANRGLAGIDGNLSTVFGISEYFERSYAILGDLTFLHDISALISPPKANCKIFVIDNNGGGIFSTLPQAGVSGFEKIFGTPHGVDILKIVKGFDIEVEVIKGESDLKRAIIHSETGLKIYVVEVPDRQTMGESLKAIYAKAANAVRMGFNLA
jgi:2-succinyl-5-enolpyruvyl-6-hydroxy-3-cyclohexene-1-carboxylate synthase